MSKLIKPLFELIILLTCLMALVGLSMDIMLPAFGDIGQDLSVYPTANIQYIVILFIFGMVFGELVFGPLADAVGRKKIILIGLAIYAIGALISLYSQAYEFLLLGRIIQGFGVAGPKIGTRALIRDLFEGAAMARLMSIIFGVLVVVPMVAPLIGQILIQATSWRFLFIGFVVLSVVLAIWLAMRQDETLTPDKRIPIAIKPLAANALLIIRHRQAMAYMLCAGLIFGAQLCYLAMAHALFVELYKVGHQFPMFFALIAAGSGLGFFANSSFVKRFKMYNIVYSALLFMVFISAAFSLVSYIADGQPPFIYFIIYCGLVFFAIGLVFGNVNALGMQYMGRVAGLAASLFASISSLVAVLFSSFFGGFYNASVLPLTLAFLCASGVSLILVTAAQKSISKPV